MKNLILSYETLSKLDITDFETYIDKYLEFPIFINDQFQTLEEVLKDIFQAERFYISEEEEKLTELYGSNLGLYAEKEWWERENNKSNPAVRQIFVNSIVSNRHLLEDDADGSTPTNDILYNFYKDAFLTHQAYLFMEKKNPPTLSPHIDFQFILEEVIPQILFAATVDYMTDTNKEYKLSVWATQIEKSVLDEMLAIIKTIVETCFIDYSQRLVDIGKKLAHLLGDDLTISYDELMELKKI